jgi:hypothetical protein
MDDIETFLDNAQALFHALEQLKAIEGPALLLPGRLEEYDFIREQASTAYTSLKQQIHAFGQQLEMEEKRLEKAARTFRKFSI